MSEPFLILHKVRGEPAFDIAEKIDEDSDGDIWIIPTSGHRAYPYARWNMEDLADISDYPHERPLHVGDRLKPEQDWPDHYACNDRPLREDTYTVQRKAAGLLESLGLVKKVVVERRD